MGAVVPLVVIPLRGWRGTLGADPIAEAENQLGLVAICLLLAALACTPLQRLAGWTWPLRLRRMLGLLGFLYATLHVVTYAVLDQGLDGRAVLEDLTQRPFIAAGAAAFALLVPLAATSTRGALRWLGHARWKRLHRLAYVAPVLGVVHFAWRVKRDLREPLTYAAVLTALLLVRLVRPPRGRT